MAAGASEKQLRSGLAASANPGFGRFAALGSSVVDDRGGPVVPECRCVSTFVGFRGRRAGHRQLPERCEPPPAAVRMEPTAARAPRAAAVGNSEGAVFCRLGFADFQAHSEGSVAWAGRSPRVGAAAPASQASFAVVVVVAVLRWGFRLRPRSVAAFAAVCSASTACGASSADNMVG